MKEVLKVIDVPVADIKPYPNNPRRNDAAVDAVAESIKKFGVLVPIVLDKNSVIVAGHTRYKALKKLGWESVPCVMADGLTDEQVRAFRLMVQLMPFRGLWMGITRKVVSNPSVFCCPAFMATPPPSAAAPPRVWPLRRGAVAGGGLPAGGRVWSRPRLPAP